MDESLQAALKGVTTAVQKSTEAAEAATEATKAATQVARETQAEFRDLRETVTRELKGLRRDHEALAAIVHGSTPPPPGAPPLDVVIAETSVRASDNSLEQAAFEGRTIAELAKIQKELAKQSRAMGLGVGFLRHVTSKAGAADLVRLVTLAAAMYGAWQTHAVMTQAPSQQTAKVTP